MAVRSPSPSLPSREEESGLRPAGRPALPARPFAELVAHLTRRQLSAHHHLTLLGWAWPLVRQLVQLAVLVFLFSRVFDLGIENYAVFVFCGLVAWTWFSAGISAAASSLISQRHLVLQPRLPSATLPMVAVAVPLLDVAFALPVLIVMIAATTELRPELLLCLPLALVQATLMAGLAWGLAALGAFFRDVPNLVGVVLGVMFYVTPVFYGLRSVPDRFDWVLHANPLTTLVEAYRSALLGTPAPSPGALAALTVGSVLLAVGGWVLFRRFEPRFADVL